MLEPQPAENYPPVPTDPAKETAKPVDPGDMRPDIDPDKLDIHKPI